MIHILIFNSIAPILFTIFVLSVFGFSHFYVSVSPVVRCKTFYRFFWLPSIHVPVILRKRHLWSEKEYGSALGVRGSSIPEFLSSRQSPVSVDDERFCSVCATLESPSPYFLAKSNKSLPDLPCFILLSVPSSFSEIPKTKKHSEFLRKLHRQNKKLTKRSK